MEGLDGRRPALDWRWVESCRAAGGVPTRELFDEAVASGREAVPVLSRVLARRSWRDPARLEESALAFHALTQRGSTVWDAAPRPPAAVRLAGLASIVLWAVVILAGRMISYTMF